MKLPSELDRTRAREIVRLSLAIKFPSALADEVDLVATGALDSMGWIDTLIGIETATGIRDFGNPWPERRPKSIGELAGMICEANIPPAIETHDATPSSPPAPQSKVSIVGWAYVLGSRTVTSEQLEQEMALPVHKLQEGAGIETVRLAASDEDELTMGQKAAECALEMARLPAEKIEFIITTSATLLGLPGLAPSLHSRLLLPENCGALDVGGACAGLIYCLSIAQSLLRSRPGSVALVVASEVHSRSLQGAAVPGEFRGLFGDGACAFIVSNIEAGREGGGLGLQDFVWGCSGTFASSLRISRTERAGLTVQFKGEQLAHAAVMQLERMVSSLERLSGTSRADVDYFAFHQPNPRVVQIVAQKSFLPLERIPQVAKTAGNLGSATCGVSLCEALTALSHRHDPGRNPVVFMAAVAPGLVWGGTYLR